MSRNLKIKSAVLAIFVVVSVVVMGLIVANMQDNISLENYTADIQSEMDELPGLIEAANEETASTRSTSRRPRASRSWRTTTPATRPPTRRCSSTRTCSASTT